MNCIHKEPCKQWIKRYRQDLSEQPLAEDPFADGVFEQIWCSICDYHTEANNDNTNIIKDIKDVLSKYE